MFAPPSVCFGMIVNDYTTGCMFCQANLRIKSKIVDLYGHRAGIRSDSWNSTESQPRSAFSGEFSRSRANRRSFAKIRLPNRSIATVRYQNPPKLNP